MHLPPHEPSLARHPVRHRRRRHPAAKAFPLMFAKFRYFSLAAHGCSAVRGIPDSRGLTRQEPIACKCMEWHEFAPLFCVQRWTAAQLAAVP